MPTFASAAVHRLLLRREQRRRPERGAGRRRSPHPRRRGTAPRPTAAVAASSVPAGAPLCRMAPATGRSPACHGDRGEEVRDGARPRRLPHQHDPVGITAERADVGAQPLDRGPQVAQRQVRRHALGREPAQRAEAVVESDDDHVVGREPGAVVRRQRRGTDAVAPARYPHQHRTRAPEVGRADLGGQAGFRLRRRDHARHQVEPADGLRRRRAGRGGVAWLPPR